MPRLVVVNGPPGCGKSTLAARFVEEHPFALCLEIDRLRRLIGHWRDDPHRAGLLAREAALAAARAHLGGGMDVVVPQYLGRVDFLARFEQLADDTGAGYAEVVLTADRDVCAARFLARNAAAAGIPGAEPTHADSQFLLERSGGVAQLGAMYDRLLLVIAARPQARVVVAPEGAIEQTWAAFTAALHTP